MKTFIALVALVGLSAVGCASNGNDAMKASSTQRPAVSGNSIQADQHATWQKYKVMHAPAAADAR